MNTAVSRRAWVIGGACTLFAMAGCSAILSLGDYSVSDVPDAGDALAPPPGDGGDGGPGSEDAGCDVDLTTTCYACTPTTTDQYLNSCTDGTCISFDRNRLNAVLLPDGGLPPLPPVDGGN